MKNLQIVLMLTLALSLCSCSNKQKDLLGPENVTAGAHIELYSVNTNDMVYNRLRPGVLENVYIKIHNTGNATLYGVKATLDFNNPYAAKYPAPNGMTAYFRSEDGSDYLVPGEVSYFGIPKDDSGTMRTDYPSFFVQTGTPWQSPTVDFTLKVSDSSGNTWDKAFSLVFR